MSSTETTLGMVYSRLRELSLQECFDPSQLESRPTATQQIILDDIASIQYRWVLGGNQSGKTGTGSRETSWVLTETHPVWTRPVGWGDETLLLLVVGRTTKQVEEVLWKKIRGFLEPDSYKEFRTGGILQKVLHIPTGNLILFFSHHGDNEAREKLQAYVAHYIWCDEMPSSFQLLEELQRRVQSKQGRFLATFTPKVVNHQIRRMVDSSTAPYGKKYRLPMLENPVHAGNHDSILATMSSFSTAYRNTLLQGDWASGEEMVYQFDHDKMVRNPLTLGYSQTNWRHVEVVDPALKSKLGLTVWAEDPQTNFWYCVVATYVSGIYDPSILVDTVHDLTQKFHVTQRVSDPHEVWYIQTAAAKKIMYSGVYKKNDRKGELIKNLQSALGTNCFVAPWCLDFFAEIEDCRWSETTDGKIVNGKRFHILDTAQYFVDTRPAPDKNYRPASHEEWLRRENEKRLRQERNKSGNMSTTHLIPGTTRGLRLGRGKHRRVW